jgi:hypothetical protein
MLRFKELYLVEYPKNSKESESIEIIGGRRGEERRVTIPLVGCSKN